MAVAVLKKQKVYTGEKLERHNSQATLLIDSDATTVAILSERYLHAGIIKELLELLDQHINTQTHEVQVSKIMNGNLVPVP